MYATNIHRKQLDYPGDYQVKGPLRNERYYFARFLHADVDRIRDLTGCSSATSLVAGILLSFYRSVHKKYGRLFRASQQWLHANMVRAYDRTMVSRALKLLRSLGVLYCRKVAGYYTNEYIHGFKGWPGEKLDVDPTDSGDLVPHAEDLIKDDPEFQYLLEDDVTRRNVQIAQLNVQSTQSNVQPAQSSIYTRASHTPSQEPAGGENFENFGSRGNSQEGSLQHVQVAENVEMDPKIDFEKGFSKDPQVCRSDKSSAPPVSTAIVNRAPSAPAVNYQPPVFTPEQQRRFEDREFLLSVAKDWIREERSVVSKAGSEAAQIRVVKTHFCNKPWQIDIEWECYMEGRVSQVCENVMHGAGGLEMVEPYLPSIASEMQSESPLLTGPMLQVIEKVADRQQHQLVAQPQQYLPSPTLQSALSADEATEASDVLEGEVIESQLSDAPSIETLQESCKTAMGRSLVAASVASNPQWGYSIVEGQVVATAPEVAPKVAPKEELTPPADPQVAPKVEHDKEVAPEVAPKVAPKVERNNELAPQVAPKVAPKVATQEIELREFSIKFGDNGAAVNWAHDWARVLSESKVAGLEAVGGYLRNGKLNIVRVSAEAHKLLRLVNWKAEPSDDVLAAARLALDLEQHQLARMAWDTI